MEPLAPEAAPIVRRMQALWESFRTPVIEVFPKAPRLPKNKKSYLTFVEGIYRDDAYHSLSIEGYHVTPELIARVQAGNWNPAENEEDRKNRDALAARGYWLASQKVKEAIEKIIGGENAGKLVRAAHRDWYRELFQPSVQAGLIGPAALAGYRRQPVFLRGSRHVPPRADVLNDAMPALFDLLEEEAEPSVRAVLGHWIFGYVHPYPDGNGRVARFLMNACVGRISVDRDTRRGQDVLFEFPRERQRRGKHPAVCQIYRGAGRAVEGWTCQDRKTTTDYFSEREQGQRPRDGQSVIGNGLVSGMKAEILARINDGSFGASYREFSRKNGVLTPGQARSSPAMTIDST